MLIDWTRDFDLQLDRLEAAADRGDSTAQTLLDYVTFQLEVLERLKGEPDEESATLKRVRQSRRHQVWRVSHKFHPDIAARLICWFPPEEKKVVVALFFGNKATIGDIFYNSVGERADIQIDKWIREKGQD
jgi:hypothetical protein